MRNAADTPLTNRLVCDFVLAREPFDELPGRLVHKPLSDKSSDNASPRQPVGRKNGQTVQNRRMDDGVSLFHAAFLRRTRELRKKWGGSQADMAEALGISQAVYEKNETRTLLDHHLIPRFAQIVQADIAYLFTGRGQFRSGDATPEAPSLKRGRNRSLSTQKSRAS